MVSVNLNVLNEIELYVALTFILLTDVHQCMIIPLWGLYKFLDDTKGL